jgi:hypothetical protein
MYGIDTVRYIVTLVKLRKLMNELNLEYEIKISKSMMKIFKKEVSKLTSTHINDFELQIVKISKAKSLLGYMLVKKNINSDNYARHIKKKKGAYKEIIFTGLHQPTKKTAKEHLEASYRVISRFIDKCFNPSIDIALDGLYDTQIDKKILDNTMSMYFNSTKDTKQYRNSYYINNILSPKSSIFTFKRLIIYDKFLKNGAYEKWKRLEVTVNISKKLTVSKIDEVLVSVSLLAGNYFDNSYYHYTSLEKQQKKLNIGE